MRVGAVQDMGRSDQRSKKQDERSLLTKSLQELSTSVEFAPR